MNNKEKAKAYHTAVSAYDVSTIEKMVEENYIQHNPKVPSGRAAFVSMIPTLKMHGSKIENIRMMEDNDHIIMHHKWVNAAPFGFEASVAFHIIRFDSQGFIAEHWNVMTGIAPLNASKRSLFDGETTITDIENTESNKAIIAKLINQMIHDDVEEITTTVIPRYFQEEFHQHNAMISDGIQGLTDAIQQGVYVPRYKKQQAVFGEGNFVLSISEGILSQKNTALYDLFRLDNAKIVEHWSIYQEIPTTDLANTNTMFNFQHRFQLSF